MTTEKKLLMNMYKKLENNKITLTDDERIYLKDLISEHFKELKRSGVIK